MITLFIAIAAGAGAFSAAYFAAGWGAGWSVAAGVFAFALSNFILVRRFKKLIETDMAAVQRIMADGQKALQAKMQRWQIRPPGSVQAAQREIAEDTKAFVREAIAAVDVLAKYRRWVPMIDRQMATAKLQLNWMIKDFKRVDEYMPKALVIDPVTASMRIARLHMTGAPKEDVRKAYEKAVRRARYNQNVLPAACWSWILVKSGDADGAFKVLTEALKNSDDATLKRNHEQLMNNRPEQFSNSGLGDQWYALHLEEPKIRTQRQRQVYR
jgi:hypothetical protein